MAIQNGDLAFKARTFKAAIEFYQSALQAKPDATYPNKMIAKIDSTEKAEIKIQAEYDEFIAKGNLDFQSQVVQQLDTDTLEWDMVLFVKQQCLL